MPNFFLWQSPIQTSSANSSANGCYANVIWRAEYQNISWETGQPKATNVWSCPHQFLWTLHLSSSLGSKKPCQLTICILFLILVPQRLIIFRFLNLSQPSYSYKCKLIKHLSRKNDCGQGEFTELCILVFIVNNVVKYCLSTRCWGLIARLQTRPAASSVISRLTPSTSSKNIILSFRIQVLRFLDPLSKSLISYYTLIIYDKTQGSEFGPFRSASHKVTRGAFMFILWWRYGM